MWPQLCVIRNDFKYTCTEDPSNQKVKISFEKVNFCITSIEKCMINITNPTFVNVFPLNQFDSFLTFENKSKSSSALEFYLTEINL